MARPYGSGSQEEAEDRPGEHLLFEAVMRCLTEDIRHPRLSGALCKGNGATIVLDRLMAVEAWSMRKAAQASGETCLASMARGSALHCCAWLASSMMRHTNTRTRSLSEN
jgi:hypothetical protein